MAKLWFADGGEWIYRAPFEDRSRWRARRRQKATGRVEKITLEAENRTRAKLELQDRAARERAEFEAGAGRPKEAPRDLGVRAALDEWLKTIDARPATIADYTNNANLFARKLGPERPVRDVGFSDIQKLLAEDWKGRSGRLKIKYLGELKRFLGWCVDSGLHCENPAAKIKIQRQWREETSDAAHDAGQALTIEEARQLLRACREPAIVDFSPKQDGKNPVEIDPPAYLFWFVFISLRTALRVSNVLGSSGKPGLQWQHLDLEEGILRKPRELMKNNRPLEVPLHEELLEELRKLRDSLGRVPAAEEPVLPGAALNVKKALRSALVRAGLAKVAKVGGRRTWTFLGELRNSAGKPFRPHDLRHSAISWLDDHCPGNVARILAGHSVAGDVHRRYVHKTLEALREGINRVPRLLGEAKIGLEKARTGRKIAAR